MKHLLLRSRAVNDARTARLQRVSVRVLVQYVPRPTGLQRGVPLGDVGRHVNGVTSPEEDRDK